MKTYHLPVLVEVDEDNFFIVSCPAFKGCHDLKTITERQEEFEDFLDTIIAESRKDEPTKSWKEVKSALKKKGKL